jgi:hypothetical protein
MELMQPGAAFGHGRIADLVLCVFARIMKLCFTAATARAIRPASTASEPARVPYPLQRIARNHMKAFEDDGYVLGEGAGRLGREKSRPADCRDLSRMSGRGLQVSQQL